MTRSTSTTSRVICHNAARRLRRHHWRLRNTGRVAVRGSVPGGRDRPRVRRWSIRPTTKNRRPRRPGVTASRPARGPRPASAAGNRSRPTAGPRRDHPRSSPRPRKRDDRRNGTPHRYHLSRAGSAYAMPWSRLPHSSRVPVCIEPDPAHEPVPRRDRARIRRRRRVRLPAAFAHRAVDPYGLALDRGTPVGFGPVRRPWATVPLPGVALPSGPASRLLRRPLASGHGNR